MLPIILGSQSPWRKALLAEAGYDFAVMSPNIDEEQFIDSDPAALVLTIAKAKAAAILQKLQHRALLITCDQVVCWREEIRGKPKNIEEAERYLRSYGEAPAETYTAVVVTDSQTLVHRSTVDWARVFFQPIPEQIIAQAIEEGHIFHCAGGFQVEGDRLFNDYILRIEGDLDSVKGLPVGVTQSLLNEMCLQT